MYDYLPKSWNLMKCFKYFLLQKKEFFWTTKSIQAELADINSIKPNEKSTRTDEGQEDVEDKAIEANDNEEPEAQVKQKAAVASLTLVKESPEDQSARFAVTPQTSKRKSAPASHSSHASGSGNKKKKPEPTPQVSNTEASQAIYKVTMGVTQCMNQLTDLLESETTIHTRMVINEILEKLTDIQDAKDKLLAFANLYEV